MRTSEIVATIAVVGTIGAFVYLNQDAHSAKNNFLQADVDPIEKEFIDHITKFGRRYGTKEEYYYRLGVFTTMYHKIAHHNAKNAETEGFTMGLNMFSDMTEEEFSQFKGYIPYQSNEEGELFEYDGPVANDIDWRNKGGVTGVKNQGSCGSCWAFSTTGAVEGAYAKGHGHLVSFSEQQLVDCSKSNHGCHGGAMVLAFEYLKSHKIEKESDYPYEARDDSCREQSSKGVVNVAEYKNIGHSDSALIGALNIGPVSVAIEADTHVFQSYTGGIISSSSCGTNLDHGVLAVGYGADYIIVKNSWGSGWGEKGYVRIKRTTGNQGICGIYKDASQPTVK